MAVDYRALITRPQVKSKRSILLKGPSGAGKTYQFRTLHTAGLNGLYMCVDEHAGTLGDLSFDICHLTNVDVPLSPTEKNPSTQPFIAMMDYLRTGDHPYDFLYFDSLMNFGHKLVQYLKHVKNVSGYELWGVFGEKMERALVTLNSLTKPTHPKPLHVIATWGVEVGQNWEGKRRVVPIVDGKIVPPRIDYKFDDVLMLKKQTDPETGEPQYVAYTTGTDEFDAKVSSGTVTLPPVILNPNLAKVLAKFDAVKEEQGGGQQQPDTEVKGA